MHEAYTHAQEFLDEFFRHTNLKLKVTPQIEAEGCMLNIEGDDIPFVMAEGGEVLDALQHLLFQAFARDLPEGKRITCDAEGYRATRAAELRLMARHAAQRVRATGMPFYFGPMSPEERRVIHMSLAEENDLHTESNGIGNKRRLQVTLKK